MLIYASILRVATVTAIVHAKAIIVMFASWPLNLQYHPSLVKQKVKLFSITLLTSAIQYRILKYMLDKSASSQNRKARVALYCTLRMRGKTKHQAAAEVGVSLGSMVNYEHEWEELCKQNEINTQSLASDSAVITKRELAVRLSQVIASPRTPPQYLAALSRALADIEGYNAPRQIDVADSRPTKSLTELLAQWNQELTHSEPGGAPPDDKNKFFLSQSPPVTDQEKGSAQLTENKATCGDEVGDAKSAGSAPPKVIVFNELDNQKFNA